MTIFLKIKENKDGSLTVTEMTQKGKKRTPLEANTVGRYFGLLGDECKDYEVIRK